MPLNDALPKEVVDVLIVGSGFGGAVMAYELSNPTNETEGQPPQSICLVERGKAYPPGSFPRTPTGVSRNFWDPDEGLFGMFNVWTFENLDAIVSSGLGGGSLIYANVMLPKDENWYTQRKPGTTAYETWALTPAHLKDHYKEVGDFLQVQTLPVSTPNEIVDSVFDLAKTRHFLAGKNPADGEPKRAPLAVRFRNELGLASVGARLTDHDEGKPNAYKNIHGDVQRTTCKLIGECDVGCNEGAKNSLDHTYLSRASVNGVSIHTLTEVVGIKRRSNTADGDLFDVRVRVHQPPTIDRPPVERDPCKPTYSETTITTRRLVLAAGALGTTFLLLENKDNLGLRGRPVGQRFCGNGDVLGLVEKANDYLDCSKGPVITAYRRYAADTDSTNDPGRDPSVAIQHGMYIEDAGYPAFAAWLVQTLGDGPGMIGSFLRQWWEKWRLRFFYKRKDTNLSAELNEFMEDGALSARFMPLLGMGRDTPDGELFLLKNNMMDSRWSLETSAAYLETMDARMTRIAESLGGRYGKNPLNKLFKRLITVHPVGGCPSDTNSFEGVVDTYGRVRGVPGLRVCDGSVFPGPVGPNPSLTIAAFARRSALNLRQENIRAEGPTRADDYTGT